MTSQVNPAYPATALYQLVDLSIYPSYIYAYDMDRLEVKSKEIKGFHTHDTSSKGHTAVPACRRTPFTQASSFVMALFLPPNTRLGVIKP